MVKVLKIDFFINKYGPSIVHLRYPFMFYNAISSILGKIIPKAIVVAKI